MFFHGILARHAYVTAEGQGAQPVIGVAAAKSPQALAEADGENFNPHAE